MTIKFNAKSALHFMTSALLVTMGAGAARADDMAVAPAAAKAPMTAGVIDDLDQPMGDPEFRNLFNDWKAGDSGFGFGAGVVSIPSLQPVDGMSLSSDFGQRSDPFTGRRKQHAGIDIPKPAGTPIYATADGTAARAEWVSGYGNMVQLEHGGGFQTRYGHMSAIAIAAGTRVKKGQVIGYVGSTGRSTGNHLHYEVRVGGMPVNPMPYMGEAQVARVSKRDGQVGMGGPSTDQR